MPYERKDYKPGDYVIAGANPVEAVSYGVAGIMIKHAPASIEPPPITVDTQKEIERRLDAVREQLSKLKKR